LAAIRTVSFKASPREHVLPNPPGLCNYQAVFSDFGDRIRIRDLHTACQKGFKVMCVVHESSDRRPESDKAFLSLRMPALNIAGTKKGFESNDV